MERAKCGKGHDRFVFADVGMREHDPFPEFESEQNLILVYFFQRRMLTEYAGNVYWKLPESTVMVLDFGAMLSGAS